MFADKLGFDESVTAQMGFKRGFSDVLGPDGKFWVEHRRDGILLNAFSAKNGVTNQAKNDILDVYFNSGTAHASWYIDLVDAASFVSLAASDTLASHGGWAELHSYSGGARKAWTQGAAASQSITNASGVVFTFTGGASVNGIFVTSQNVWGTTTGILWSTALFPAALPVLTNDQLTVTYTLSL